MAILTAKTPALEFVISDLDALSYDNATLISGQNLTAGFVLGKITTGGKLTRCAHAAVDGSQTAYAILAADCDASAGDTTALVLVRGAQVIDSYITYAATANAAQILAQKASLALALVVTR